MTAQVPDTVEVDGVDHALVGVAGNGLFEPFAHGAEPRMMHTGCWRGFICHYAVRDDVLHLASLDLGAGSLVDGVTAKPGMPWLGAVAEPLGGHVRYRFAALPVPFTGTLLAGDGFVRETYVHMGHASAWQYERVVELVVDGGRVTERRDRSAEMADVRRSIQQDERRHPDGPRGGPGWVARTFRRGYDRTFGNPRRPPGS